MKEVNEKIFNDDNAEIITVYPEQELKHEKGLKFWYKDGDRLKIEQRLFIEFLGSLGIKKYFQGNDFIVVENDNNIVREVGTVNIKDKIKNYFDSLDEELEEGIDKNTVHTKIITMSPTLFSKSYLEFLPTLTLDFKRDIKEEAYIFYQNCFVKINKDEYKTYNYEELDGCIWESQKLKRNFYSSDIESAFSVFIYRICNEDLKRYNALRSAIGYLLHSYKDSAFTKAIIFIDERSGEGANGRCGKSLVGKAIGKIRNSVRPDGKNFKFGQFMFQSVKADTAIIDFNDIKKNFPFENLFSIITDDMAVEKKNKDEIIIPFEYSPKILITTNHAIKGIDASTLDREYVVEFSDHYNEHHKPIHEFKKNFFTQWDEEEWNSFDNFMIECLQLYLKNGLVEYERINLTQKMLIESTSEEFIEFMEEIEFEKRYDKKELHNKFIEIYSDYKIGFTQRTFSSWIKNYAKLKGLKFEVKNSGSSKGFMLTKMNK